MGLLFPTADPSLFREPLLQRRPVRVKGKTDAELIGWITDAHGRRLFAELTFGTTFAPLAHIQETADVAGQ